MSFTEEVITRTRRIEKLLADSGGAGKGLHERASSLAHRLDGVLLRRLRFVAAVRNKVVHVDGYKFDGDQQRFLATCDEVAAALNSLATARVPLPTTIKAGTNAARQEEGAGSDKNPWRGSSLAAVGCVILCILGLPFTCTHYVVRSGRLPTADTLLEEVDWSAVCVWLMVWTTVVFFVTFSLSNRR